MDRDLLQELLGALRAQAREILIGAGATADEIPLRAHSRCPLCRTRIRDFRPPVGKSKAVRVSPKKVTRRFSVEYENRFGRQISGIPAEIVTWRVRATAEPSMPPTLMQAPVSSGIAAVKGRRSAYFPRYPASWSVL